MSQHTQSPWVIGARDPGKGTIFVTTLTGAVIARLQVEMNGQANARLIAAAPELLEAAKELLETFFTATNDVANGLREAVAKAEGREPVSLQEEIDRS